MSTLQAWVNRARDYTVAHIDKLVHFIAGALLAAYLTPEGPAVAFSAVVVAAVLKEVMDHFDGGDVEALDIVATVAGGVLSLLVHWLPQIWSVV